MPRVAELLLTCALLTVLQGHGWADFSNESLISNDGETASAPDLFIDVTDNVLIAWIEAAEVLFAVGPHFDVAATAVTDDDLEQSNPAVHVSSTATITFVYSEADAATPTERELIAHQSILGTFQDPEALTDTDDDDRTPDIALHSGSDIDIAWVVDDGDTVEVWISSDLEEGEMVAEGSDPQLFKDADGSLHLLYVRDGSLFYQIDEGDGFDEEIQVTDDDEDDSEPSIVASSLGTPGIAWARAGDIYYTEGDLSGGFAAEVNVTDSDDSCSRPRLVRHEDGLVSHLVFLQEGDVYLSTVISTTFITSAVRVSETDENESSVAAAVDALGYVHVTYLRDDELYYTNDAPVPEPAVAVSESLGDSPLTVEFTYTGTGPVTHYRWDFGDGEQSLNDNPTHVYEDEGIYDVTLTVSGPGGRVEETFVGLVEVTEPANQMWLPSLTLVEGQEDAVIPIFGSHDEVIQGYQIAAAYDGTVIAVDDLLLSATAVRKMYPEFLAINIVEDDEDSYFTLGLIIDSLPPFDGRELEASDEQRLINIDLDVLTELDTPLSTTIDLRQDLSYPIIFNVFTVDGESRTPGLGDGVFEIIEDAEPLPGPMFVRGDSNENGAVNLLDVLEMLDYVFFNATEPACLDAADTNDDGNLTISDAVVTLEFIFQNGKVIAYPYPGAGFDPTDDDLGCGD